MWKAEQVTRLLQEWADGRPEARDELIPLVYDALRRLASHYLSEERYATTLQPTALVHEAYLRLVDQSLPGFCNRSHFYGVAAQLMRQILVDHARARRSLKRGGRAVMVEFSETTLAPAGKGTDLLALNDALESLAAVDPRKWRIIELRYFGGFTEDETAEFLALSTRTVRREARLAEAWLYTQLHPA